MSQPLIYVKGDPRCTKYLDQLRLIASLIDKSTVYYVTSIHWGEIIAELDAQYRDRLMDPAKPAPWDGEGGNRPIKIGVKEPFLTVYNSGTEDQDVCNLLNDEPARIANFGARRDKLRVA